MSKDLQKVFFAGTKENPYHLSVGIVLRFKDQIVLIKKENGKIFLPSETFYSNESIKQAIARCTKEEIGIESTLVQKFLGNIQTTFVREESSVDKTTIYFEVKALTNVSAERIPEIDEVDDQILWLDLVQSLNLLKEQNNKEYTVLERLLRQA